MWKLFKKSLFTPTATISYPAVNTSVPDALRGKPVVNLEKCLGCMACTEICPSKALTKGKNSLTLNLAACIFCGLCQDGCPQGAINLNSDFELAARHKGDLMETYCLEDDSQVPEQDLDFLAHELKGKVNRLFGRSLQIRHMDTGSCNGCDWDMSCLLNSVHDVQRLGIDFVASPRHADMLFCSGAVSVHLQQALQRTYAAVPAPKLVAAVGTCACSGGIYKDGYAVLGGVDKVLPVDVYIPGCPPRPQAMLQGILLALDRLEQKTSYKVYKRNNH